MLIRCGNLQIVDIICFLSCVPSNLRFIMQLYWLGLFLCSLLSLSSWIWCHIYLVSSVVLIMWVIRLGCLQMIGKGRNCNFECVLLICLGHCVITLSLSSQFDKGTYMFFTGYKILACKKIKWFIIYMIFNFQVVNWHLFFCFSSYCHFVTKCQHKKVLPKAKTNRLRFLLIQVIMKLLILMLNRVTLRLILVPMKMGKENWHPRCGILLIEKKLTGFGLLFAKVVVRSYQEKGLPEHPI